MLFYKPHNVERQIVMASKDWNQLRAHFQMVQLLIKKQMNWSLLSKHNPVFIMFIITNKKLIFVCTSPYPKSKLAVFFFLYTKEMKKKRKKENCALETNEAYNLST